MRSLTIAIGVTYKAIRWTVIFDKEVVVPQHVMVRVIGMADALSDYSHRRHLQSHTMDGQSRIGGSYLKIVAGD